jgi:hypothetical protein
MYSKSMSEQCEAFPADVSESEKVSSPVNSVGSSTSVTVSSSYSNDAVTYFFAAKGARSSRKPKLSRKF